MSESQLVFEREEYDRRLAAVRRHMQEKGVDVLLTTVPENIYYLTGYDSMGYFTYQILIIPLDTDPIFLTRALNTDKARMYSCLRQVEGWDDLSSPAQATLEVLQKYRLQGKRLANQNDAWFLSVNQYNYICERLG